MTTLPPRLLDLLIEADPRYTIGVLYAGEYFQIEEVFKTIPDATVEIKRLVELFKKSKINADPHNIEKMKIYLRESSTQQILEKWVLVSGERSSPSDWGK